MPESRNDRLSGIVLQVCGPRGAVPVLSLGNWQGDYPKSLIRLLRANEVFFLSFVLSLLGYNGTL